MKHLLILVFFFISANIIAQNNAILLNGTDEYLTVPHKDEQNIGENFTIEAWILANEWKDAAFQGSLVNKDTSGPDRGFAFRCGDEGRLSFVMAVNNSWVEALSAQIMNAGQWHHVSVVINSGSIELFIDGESVALKSFNGTYSDSDVPLYIGESSGFSGRNFDGIIDEVRIWNIARTQEELNTYSANELAGNESGLVAYYQMNDGIGSTATNLIDSNCNATLINMDDSNWVDGFVIADYDLSVRSVAVDLYNMKYRPQKLSVVIDNLGALSMENIQLAVYLNDEISFLEGIPESIASGTTLVYDFKTPLDLRGIQNPAIRVEIVNDLDENNLNNSSGLSISTIEGNTIRLFDQVQHNFGSAGQNQNVFAKLPGDLSEFQQILLHIDLECPNTDCDPWDQPANISIIKPEGNFEIARYVTPYGIACGPWTVDVTDFKTLFEGANFYNSYIQVWGASGWLVTIDLELIEGTSDYPYQKLHNLWGLDYHVYGDPDIDDNLPEVEINLAENTLASHIRKTVSGHGQANTDNAAEFSPKTHDVVVNGDVINEHYLWKDDCADNDCANQAGTWLYSRAGWCPGQQVIPYIVETELEAGSAASFDYELEEYTNFLNTGYNGSSHTEPHYRIWSYFVEKSNTPYNNLNNLKALLVEPYFDANGLAGYAFIIENKGTEAISNYTLSCWINNELAISDLIEAPLAAGDIYQHIFLYPETTSPNLNDVIYAVIENPNDENIGDDIADFILESGLNNEILYQPNSIKVFPNPSSNGLFTLETDKSLLGNEIIVINALGKTIYNSEITETATVINIDKKGVFYLYIQGKTKSKILKKLINLK